ncbi:hypothetical protein ABZX40_19760 [Streptomyces sp. NPDC004610]|uniref:hypothetical protein n=1 Tax=unclassified Streptomyces TaxID=2593676 RepID=UPI0033A2C768
MASLPGTGRAPPSASRTTSSTRSPIPSRTTIPPTDATPDDEDEDDEDGKDEDGKDDDNDDNDDNDDHDDGTTTALPSVPCPAASATYSHEENSA